MIVKQDLAANNMSASVFRQVMALIWEMLSPNRIAIYGIAAIILLDFLVNYLLGISFNADGQYESLVGQLNLLFYGISLILVLHVSSYTEFNARRERKGFPHRLFILPVSSLLLVSVPTFIGLFLVELIFLLNHFFGTAIALITNPVWVAVRLGVFMLSYQMIMWWQEKLGSLRLVSIGIAGIFLTTLDNPQTSWLLITVWGLASFLWSWRSIVLLRSGRQRTCINLPRFFNQLNYIAPSRTKQFSSVISAQMWFEWRRAGYILPLTVLAILGLVIGPLTVLTRESADTAAIIFALIIALPVILAIPVGKGFSKGDLWSEDMAIPSFMIVRPLSSKDIVGVKLKSAALSTTITWIIVLLFLLAWLPFWASLDYIALVGNYFWEVQGHSLVSQVVTFVLIVFVSMLLTWRFMVSGLWIGLSRHRKLFVASVVPLILLLFLGPDGLDELVRWVMNDYTRLSIVVWSAVIVTIVKFWIAAWTWREEDSDFIFRYLMVWFIGTGCALALSIFVWTAFRYVIGLDTHLIQSLLVTVALLVMPLAQIPLAARFLSANRHR